MRNFVIFGPSSAQNQITISLHLHEDVDALVNKAYESFEAANHTITAMRIEISCLEHENQRLKDEVSQLEEQADDLIDERDRLQQTVVHLAASHIEPREAFATPTEKSVTKPASFN